MDFKQVVFVNEFTDGILDPSKPFEQGVVDGGRIVASTAPGCWGPMITPELKGGHEVTRPVAVEGAEIGDSIAIYIEQVQVTSHATASGGDEMVEGRFTSDAFVSKHCPGCGAVRPSTHIEGTGADSIRCDACGAVLTPFHMTEGYTMVLDHASNMAITVDEKNAVIIGEDGRNAMCTPDNSVQNPVVALAPHDMVGTVTRISPMLGQLGTTPARAFPDSHNAGDFAQFLLNAEHEYAMTEEEIEDRTDGHMDINRVRQGAWVIAPVKVDGAGVYVGDMHAMMGNGEIAGHTADIAGVATLRVHLLKGLTIDGPIILPIEEDLPRLARPLTDDELASAKRIAKGLGMEELEDSLPISFVGTGANMNDAIQNGLERASKVLGVSVDEVMNRATITGDVEIGRAPGTATVSFLCPRKLIAHEGLLEIMAQNYGA